MLKGLDKKIKGAVQAVKNSNKMQVYDKASKEIRDAVRAKMQLLTEADKVHATEYAEVQQNYADIEAQHDQIYGAFSSGSTDQAAFIKMLDLQNTIKSRFDEAFNKLKKLSTDQGNNVDATPGKDESVESLQAKLQALQLKKEIAKAEAELAALTPQKAPILLSNAAKEASTGTPAANESSDEVLKERPGSQNSHSSLRNN